MEQCSGRHLSSTWWYPDYHHIIIISPDNRVDLIIYKSSLHDHSPSQSEDSPSLCLPEMTANGNHVGVYVTTISGTLSFNKTRFWFFFTRFKFSKLIVSNKYLVVVISDDIALYWYAQCICSLFMVVVWYFKYSICFFICLCVHWEMVQSTDKVAREVCCGHFVSQSKMLELCMTKMSSLFA